MKNPLAAAQYRLAAHLPHQLPPDVGAEVAFAGRSNAGKSSALNTICHQNSLARTSKTPGRTQQLVFFEVQPEVHLVDLPGYGYAKVPENLRIHWQQFINEYFETRQALAGLVVVMDIRHPMRDFDKHMLNFAFRRGMPAHCLLTKSDKVGRGEQSKTILAVKKELASIASVQLFSSETKLGVDEARGVVAKWLGIGPT
jgi:GTP-binding protein